MSENSYNSVTNLSETAQGVPPPHAASDQYSREGTAMANAHSIPISDSNSIDQLPFVEIYVDGACDPNPGAGGIGAVLIFGNARKEISEPIGRTTNNGAELQAAITALMSLKKTCRVVIYSDSRYLVSTMNGEFRKGTNLELWNDLEFAALRHTCEWRWCKGHDGNPLNERAHTLAEQAVRRNGRLA